MDSYATPTVFSVPQTALQRCIKHRKESSNEEIKAKLSREQVLPCEAENDLTEQCL
jgi:hypothetical protein